MEQPDSNLLFSLPNEQLFEIVLNLPDEKLADFCSRNSRFANICSDPLFWKEKLRRKFPNVDLKTLTGPQYRAKYQLESAKLLDEQRDKLEKVMRKDLRSMSRKKESSRNIAVKEEEYLREIDKLKRQADYLFKLAEKVLIIPRNVKYIKLTVPESYLDQIDDLGEHKLEREYHSFFTRQIHIDFGKLNNDAEKLWIWFEENGWKIPQNLQPAEGILFGIRFPYSSGPAPFGLIHIYYSRGRFLFSFSTATFPNDWSMDRNDFPRSLNNLSSEEIATLYDLNFEIRH